MQVTRLDNLWDPQPTAVATYVVACVHSQVDRRPTCPLVERNACPTYLVVRVLVEQLARSAALMAEKISQPTRPRTRSVT